MEPSLALGTLALVLVAWELWEERRAPQVSARFSGSPGAEPLAVAVLIPARDEAAHVDALLEGLQRQSTPPREIVVVDDQSQDDTFARAQAWQARLPQLRVLRGAPLPDGWTGKSWALTQAAQATTSSLLLFLDADVVPGPELCAALPAHARAHGLEALSAFPRLSLDTAAERLVLPAFHTLLYTLYPLHRWRQTPFAIGQCLLVERAAYERAGGHAAVRAQVLEDVELARRLHAAGAPVQTAQAFEHMRCHMYPDTRALVEGLQKHAAAGYRSGGSRSAFAGTWLFFTGLLPPVALVLSLAFRSPTGAGLALLAFAARGALLWRRYRASPLRAFTFFLGAGAYLTLAMQAFRKARRGAHVTWKGRVLPSGQYEKSE